MKKLRFILIALVIVCAMIITGCSSSLTPSTTAPPATSAAPKTTAPPISSAAPTASVPPATTKPPATTQAPAGVITLKFAFDMPTTAAVAPSFSWFADQLQKQSNGKVKVDLYPGASLFKQTDTADSLKAGIADIANISLSNNSQLFPITNVFDTAGLEFPDSTRDEMMTKYKAYLQLSQKYPVFKNEMADYKLLMFNPSSAYRIIGKKKIAVPNDLKGVKLAGSNMQGQITKYGGGVWVQGVPNDYYDGMTKGTFDGAFASWAQVSVYKFEEVASNFLDYGFTQTTQMICMNQKTWNSLPPDIQKLIMDIAPGAIEQNCDGQLSSSQKGINNAKAKGRTITTLTTDQRALWDTTIAPISDDWVKNAQSKGVSNAADILKDLKGVRAAAYK
jgi:TRAP-type transport system periplasmic protein